jgi:hypothetical protein
MKKIKLLPIAFLTTFFFSCTKQHDITQKSELEIVAYKTLKSQMTSTDFSTLNWNTVKEERINGEPVLLKIQSRINLSQTLLFAKSEGKLFYNWVELNVIERQKNIVTGNLVLKALDNTIINQFTIINNKIVSNNLTTKQESTVTARNTDNDPYIELPEITVISYLYSQPSNWWSLYWLFNMNNYWYNQYTLDQSIVPSDGGGGTILPIEDLYPETAEIQKFENDYRSQMYAEELQIFDSMSRGYQLKYLWNAKNASERAQSLYPGTVHNGKGDAYRHAYFSALNSKSLGLDLAKRLGDAHENNPNQPNLERAMDLKNNHIGRDLFVWLHQLGFDVDYFREILAIKLAQMMDNGELWHLSPLGPKGEVIPGVTELVRVNQ